MASLTDLLQSRRAQILERWTQRIEWAHAPQELTRGELWDHLPNILDELLGALRVAAGQRAESPLPDQSPASAQHGTQRLRVGFDVEEVVREYGILQDILLDELAAAEHSLDHREWRLALQSISTAIAEAVTAYVSRRDEELRREAQRHVAFIAHELRNPLGTVRNASAALRLAPADERLYDLLDRNLQHLGDLVDQVLVADRLAQKIELRRERLDLSALLSQTVEDARASGESKNVTIALEADPQLEMDGDRRLVVSTLGNLLSNAVKFTPAGGVIRVRAHRAPEAVILEVDDECGGLPPGRTDELFEPFVQRGHDRTGFGLGLAIVRQAVSAHGGQVAIQDRSPKGCTFTVTLPTGVAK
jgi:signal transduction histidine kinase